jgi:hypothetical protein
MVDPSPANPSWTASLALWYTQNKCLAIFLLIVIILVILGGIFAIVWFLILHKGTGDSSTTTVTPVANTAAHLVSLGGVHLRSILHS